MNERLHDMTPHVMLLDISQLVYIKKIKVKERYD